jgi:hypothetical protein
MNRGRRRSLTNTTIVLLGESVWLYSCTEMCVVELLSPLALALNATTVLYTLRKAPETCVLCCFECVLTSREGRVRVRAGFRPGRSLLLFYSSTFVLGLDGMWMHVGWYNMCHVCPLRQHQYHERRKK